MVLFLVIKQPNEAVHLLTLQYLRGTLSRQPCERLLASPRRQLLCEGPVTLIGQSCLEFIICVTKNKDYNYLAVE